MNLFNIDLFQKTLDLMKETLKLKKYKAMHKCFAVFIFIFMLPLVALSFIVSANLFCLSFFLQIIQSPVESLKSLVNSEGKEVKHATQFIIYFISWPLIFMYYVIVALLRVYAYIEYAVLSCLNYAWTLGGFRFHLFVDKSEDISIEVNEKYNNAWLIIYIVIMAIITFLVPLIKGVDLFIDLYTIYSEEYFFEYFIPELIECISFGMLFSLFYSYIGFCPRPKVSNNL